MINYELLKRLCSANSISGDEGSVREIIINEIKSCVTTLEVDALGNILVFNQGKKRAEKKLMISAHIDEVGFIVTDIDENGLVKFDEVGGIDRRVLLGRSVTINNKINGIIGVKPIHLCDNNERNAIPKYSSMYIDIGAESREEALRVVSLGDSVCFDSFWEENGCTIKSKALDDRVGCFIMINMIQSELEYDTHFAFVVQEEVGLHGSKTAAFTLAPEYSLVLEATTAADIPSTSNKVCELGKGAVIGYMDKRTIYDKGLIAKAVEISKEENIPMQFKRAVAGGNDAGAIHESRSGVRTLAVSLPCRYLHAQLSVISSEDLCSVQNLCEKLAESISGGEV